MKESVRPLLIVFAILFWISAYSLAEAATYYVSPAGNNANPGTINQPFLTLQRAHDVANPGDTIYMRGGTYDVPHVIVLSRDGSSGNPISLFAYPGETPILDGSNGNDSYVSKNYDGWVLALDGANWWYIRGLEIARGNLGGLDIYAASSNNIIANLNVHHNGGTGIMVLGSGANNLIFNNDSHHNRDIANGNADGFGLGNTTGLGNVARGNRAWRNSDDGIDLYNNQPNVGGAWLVENNWSWENGLDDNLQATGGNGVGFKLGGQKTGGTSGGHTVRLNVTWKNYTSGFDQNGANTGGYFYNNTAWANNYGNKGASNINFSYTATPANVIQNNLEYSGGAAINAGAINDQNSWNLSVTVNSADFASLDYSSASGPRAGDGSLPNISFLHLVAGSDLIDKGTNIGIAYTGSAPDLGAYEYTNSVAPPAAPSNLVLH